MFYKGPNFYRKVDGTAAVEFAIIAPVFIFMLFGMIAFGIWLSAANTIQSVTAGAARASIAGLNGNERELLARNYVTTSLASNPLFDPDRIEVAVFEDPRTDQTFRVAVSYDATELPIWNLVGSELLPGETIRREAVVVVGGR